MTKGLVRGKGLAEGQPTSKLVTLYYDHAPPPAFTTNTPYHRRGRPPRSSLYRSSLVGTVICARQLFGDNTVLPHYESHTVNLTVV